MTIYLCPHLATAERTAIAKDAAACLEDMGIRVLMSAEDSIRLYGNAGHAGDLQDAEMVVSVGGDGAVLRAAKKAVSAGLPLMGVNGGRLGFLCALEASELPGLDQARLRAMPTEQRSILSVAIDGSSYLALNDIVIARRRLAGTLSAAVHRDGRELMRFRGDGLIVATPTGSTAYSRSAGGPVLLPDTGCFTLTPICAHTPGITPLVVPDRGEYQVTVTDTGDDCADVLADGVTIGSARSPLTVRRHRQALTLVRRFVG